MTVVTVNELSSINSSITEESSKRKRRRESTRDRNAEQVATKYAACTKMKRHDKALKGGLELTAYADRIQKRIWRNPLYMKR